MANMTRAHLNYIADNFGPLVEWPSKIPDMADKLQPTNPRFDRDRFIERATRAWEQAHEIAEFHDEIPY